MQLGKCAMCATGECLHPEEESVECQQRPAELLLNGTGFCTPCGRGRIVLEQQIAFREIHGFGSTGNDEPTAPSGPTDLLRIVHGGNVKFGEDADPNFTAHVRVNDAIHRAIDSTLFGGGTVEPGIGTDGPAGV